MDTKSHTVPNGIDNKGRHIPHYWPIELYKLTAFLEDKCGINDNTMLYMLGDYIRVKELLEKMPYASRKAITLTIDHDKGEPENYLQALCAAIRETVSQEFIGSQRWTHANFANVCHRNGMEVFYDLFKFLLNRNVKVSFQ